MNKLVQTTILLMITTIISKVLGFAREVVLTATYGTSIITDAYITSFSIPTILFAVVGTAIKTSYIPLACEISNKKGEKATLEFTNNVLNIVVLIGIIICIISTLYTEELIKIFAMDFSGEVLSLTIQFTQIMIYGVIFIGLSNVMSAWLNMHENFSIPGIIGIPFNILIIGGIIFSKDLNIEIMAVGTLLAMISQFLIQYPFAKKEGYKYRLYINIKDEYIKRMIMLIAPVFIGVGVNQLNIIIDRSLASTLGDGVITILNSANRLNGFVIGLFITTIASVIYPALSKLSNSDDREEFNKYVLKSINIVILIIIPISVGAIVLSEPVVRLVFERGAFTENDTYMTSVALSCYSIGMIGFGLREVLNKIFYSLKDTKTPMINGSISMILNIIMNLILIDRLGYRGLALSTSFSAIICIILFTKSLKKHLGYFGQDKIIKTLCKSLISSFVMGIFTFLIYRLLSSNLHYGIISEVANLIISIFAGAGIYGAIIYMLGIPEIEDFIYSIKKRRKSNV